MRPDLGYPPIADYALIGNRHTCALVSSAGSIDWCCLPYLESPSVFGAILDLNRGGWWRVAPVGEARSSRAYMGSSAVLETVFAGADGALSLRDLLPIRHSDDGDRSDSFHEIVRIVECTAGEVEVQMEWSPRPNYGRDDIRIARDGHVLAARTDRDSFWLAGLPEGVAIEFAGAAAVAQFRLRAGESASLVFGWGERPQRSPAARAEEALRTTLHWWDRWSGACCIGVGAGRWSDPVLRSGMVLKLLTNERTGAIAAAPTTSLPEEIGGVRNWDYRYCWVRDASLITQALLSLGQRQEGIAFLRFLEAAAQQHQDPARVQVLYGLNGERHLPEYTLGHLDGYRDSRPVRIGNGAAIQRQLDVYGELLDAAHSLLQIGGEIPLDQWAWLRRVTDYVCHVWRETDRGIWEVRGPERHFTYSKLMCWVALDRALRIADRLGWRGGVGRWRRERAAIRRAILDHGFDPGRGAFVQSFGSATLDASNLLIPLVGFLPATDPRVVGTVDATLRDLTENGLVYRYHAHEAADGVSGGEGAFGICTFWLADALALGGRTEEAAEIFEGMLARANDIGLYAEEIDTRTGEFLGNFPQAFTHVGLIHSSQLLGGAMSEEPERAGADIIR